jgi:hypothetical protein
MNILFQALLLLGGIGLGILVTLLYTYTVMLARDQAQHDSYNLATTRYKELENQLRTDMLTRDVRYNEKIKEYLQTIREVLSHRDEYALGFTKYVAQRMDSTVLNNLEAHIPRLLKDYEAGLQHNKTFKPEPTKSGL